MEQPTLQGLDRATSVKNRSETVRAYDVQWIIISPDSIITSDSAGNVTIDANVSGHDPVTLAADADVLLGLFTQELNFDTQTANTIFAGPSSGAAADPTFRTLVDDDVPNTITIAGGTDIAVADGGTGKSSWTQYLVPYADTTTSFSQIAIGTSGQVLTSNGAGSAPTFQAAAGGGPTYWQYTLLPESSVLDDGSPPAITVIESTGTGTVRFRVADFDSATDEIIYWTFVMPSDYSTALSMDAAINWYVNAASNNSVVWGLQISATTSNDADTMAEQVVATTNLSTDAANGTEANRLITSTLIISYDDSVAGGDAVTFRFYRDADNSSDTLASDARLHSIRLRIPRA